MAQMHKSGLCLLSKARVRTRGGKSKLWMSNNSFRRLSNTLEVPVKDPDNLHRVKTLVLGC